MLFYIHILSFSLLKCSRRLCLEHNKYFMVYLVILKSGIPMTSFLLLLVLTHIVDLIIFLPLLNTLKTLFVEIIWDLGWYYLLPKEIFIWFYQVPKGNRIPIPSSKFEVSLGQPLKESGRRPCKISISSSSPSLPGYSSLKC